MHVEIARTRSQAAWVFQQSGTGRAIAMTPMCVEILNPLNNSSHQHQQRVCVCVLVRPRNRARTCVCRRVCTHTYAERTRVRDHLAYDYAHLQEGTHAAQRQDLGRCLCGRQEDVEDAHAGPRVGMV